MNTTHFACMILALGLFLPRLAPAQEKNGLLVTVQKTTLSRDDVNNRAYYADTIDRTIGLKITVRNNSLKNMEPAQVEHFMVVSRWSYSPMRYESYTGTADLVALKPQTSAELVVGSSQIGGYKNYSRRYQDKVEAWKVVIKRDGTEVASFQSSSDFDHLYEKAHKAATH